MNIREKNWGRVNNNFFDVVIVGGGINGASIFRELSREGYKVLLLDKSDFSCGTSQASAMMIWGGLLYLKNFDILSVYNYSRDRDKMIKSFNSQISAKHFRYISNSEWGRNKYFSYFALLFYWMLGNCRREGPQFEKRFDEAIFLNKKNSNESILYEEGFLNQSDSRFVLDWIFKYQTEDCLAINYCSIKEASYNNKDKNWTLDLKDHFLQYECTVKAKMVLNCAGVWTDEVNNEFGINSPYKHVYSKGVFIGYERPEGHKVPLIFEMGEHGDTLTFIPWGPVSLWGPTETRVTSIEDGYKITPEDTDFLLKHASRNLDPSVVNSKIISFRCGLRPLAVKKSFESDCYPLNISRKHIIVEDSHLPWISIYGGKISGCISLAEKVMKRIGNKIVPKGMGCQEFDNRIEKPLWTLFPGLDEDVPSIDWCVRHEFCCTLEDYLRRRTNISQWVPREGLGFRSENLEYLKSLTAYLPMNSGTGENSCLSEYVEKVGDRFDKISNGID